MLSAENSQSAKHENVLTLFQFGNTCYCNSVLQALYFCRPFREKVLQYKHQQKNQKKETLLTCLADLFYSIATQKKKVGTLAPKRFITRLRKEYGKGCIYTNFSCAFGFHINPSLPSGFLYLSSLDRSISNSEVSGYFYRTCL